MRLGLIGLPLSGKTTIFNALTGSNRPASSGVPGKLDVQIAVVDVPDPRLDELNELFRPQRKVHAKITYADIGGLSKGIGSSGLSGQFRNELNTMDAFLHIIRVFDNPAVPHPEETLDPQRDLEILDGEFLLSDLVAVEKRIERLREEMGKGKDREANAREMALFERLNEALNAEQPLRTLDLTAAERNSLRGYGLLTVRPRLVILNMGEEMEPTEGVVVVKDGSPVMAVQGALEAEIAQLEPDEAALFMQEYGISEPTRDRAISASYNLLHIQTFFTVGEDEVRAWPHPIGATAQEAAGEIHTDLMRGFIRAEIVPQDVLLALGGLAEARQAGKLRLEGKDYVMQDGDVMTVRFNV